MKVARASKNKYRESSDEEKIIKREYEENRYQNMSEENKQGPKNYRNTKKST